MFFKVVISCLKHPTFFDETCETCKKEYFFVKGLEEKDGLSSSTRMSHRPMKNRLCIKNLQKKKQNNCTKSYFSII